MPGPVRRIAALAPAGRWPQEPRRGGFRADLGNEQLQQLLREPCDDLSPVSVAQRKPDGDVPERGEPAKRAVPLDQADT